jgi:hypothetical protein
MLGVPCFAEPRDLLLRSIWSFRIDEVSVVAIDNGSTDEVKSTLEYICQSGMEPDSETLPREVRR